MIWLLLCLIPCILAAVLVWRAVATGKALDVKLAAMHEAECEGYVDREKCAGCSYCEYCTIAARHYILPRQGG